MNTFKNELVKDLLTQVQDLCVYYDGPVTVESLQDAILTYNNMVRSWTEQNSKLSLKAIYLLTCFRGSCPAMS